MSIPEPPAWGRVECLACGRVMSAAVYILHPLVCPNSTALAGAAPQPPVGGDS